MENSLTIEIAENRFQFAACVYIRSIVFFGEQNVPFSEEINEEEDCAVYYIGWYNGLPASTARYRILPDNIGKIERVATLKEHRGRGFGKTLLGQIINDLMGNTKLQKIKLSSQDHAISFYERLGFKTIGNGFMEAGIPHHLMFLDAPFQTGSDHNRNSVA